jgi:hypothetical protein
LVEVAEVKFLVGKWTWDLIICLLDVLKCDFREVDEAMFESEKVHANSFSASLDIQKSDLDEFPEVMFQLGKWP